MYKKILYFLLIIIGLLFIIFNCTMSADSGSSSGGSSSGSNISVSIISDYTDPIPSGASLFLESVIVNGDINDVTFTWYVDSVKKGSSSKYFDFKEITTAIMTADDRKFTVEVVAANGISSDTASIDIIVDSPVRLDDVLSSSEFTNSALKDFITPKLGYGMVYVHDLTELDFSNETFTNFSNIEKFTSLRKVSFGNRQLYSAQLAPFANCMSLITLEWSYVTNFDISCLSVFDKDSLRKLSLSYCDIEYEDMTMIASFTKLTDLDLASNGDLKDIPNNIPVAGLISNLSDLEVLNLYNSDISKILLLSNCKELNYLDIQNTYVLESDKNSLQTSLPDCNIDWSLKIF